MKKLRNNKVIIIAGPTAIGKTALSIGLAKKYNGEIINGDSQQVYREVSIGTAKVSKSQQEAIRHHLIDIRDLSETFSAYDFVTAANKAIADILSRGKLPIIVGGTGLYLQSLVEGFHLGGDKHHEEMQVLRQQLELLTDEQLYNQLAKEEIEVDQLNRRRAIRALELFKYSDHAENKKSDYNFLVIGLNTERARLYERINQRVDMMMAAGLLSEAKYLYDEFNDAQVSKAIGYKEFFPYFDGQSSLATAVDLVKRNSRRYSKRQITWFKNRMGVAFLDVFSDHFQAVVIEKVERFLNDKN